MPKTEAPTKEKIDLSQLHPDMAIKLLVYRDVWAQYDADIEESCECLVSGCLLDGNACEDAFDIFNVQECCKAMETEE